MFDRISINPGRVLITPENGSGAYYATMTRADNPTQDGTPLNKANLLKDVTASLFGLNENASVNNIFEYLGQYSQHWWARKSMSSITMYSEDNKSFSSVYGGSYFSIRLDKATVYIADSVSFDETTGKHTLVNPSALSTLSNVSFTGKYLYSSGGGLLKGQTDSTTAITDVILITKYSTSSGTSTYGTYSTTNATVLQSASYVVDTGVTTYVKSPDRNAYPDSGNNGSFSYTYIGVPFDNAATAPKVATGSYTGTGQYGSTSKANSLTFNLTPKIVIIRGTSDGRMAIMPVHGWTSDYTARAYQVMGNSTSNLNPGYNMGKINGNTISWYWNSTGSQSLDQLNESGKTYYYIAIG